MNRHDLIRLGIGLTILAFIFLLAHLLGTLYHPEEKYSHPATRPGASWKTP
jgi:hypothetical protein